jgi:hypothetical protein
MVSPREFSVVKGEQTACPAALDYLSAISLSTLVEAQRFSAQTLGRMTTKIQKKTPHTTEDCKDSIGGNRLLQRTLSYGRDLRSSVIAAPALKRVEIEINDWRDVESKRL